MARFHEQARYGAWLHRGRIIAYARVLLFCEGVAFVFLALGTHGYIVPMDHPAPTDFISFYAAGRLADTGQAAAVYDQARHYATEIAIVGRPGFANNFFFYPPSFLPLCALLGLLPQSLAFLVWEGGQLLFYLYAIRRIVGRTEPLILFVAFPATLEAIGIGQNGLLTASFFALALEAACRPPARRHALSAGVWFGMQCYKPHLAVLVPVALLAAGRWASLAAGIATVAVLVGISILLFGTAPWSGFFHIALAAKGTYESGRVVFSGFISPFGAARMLGASPAMAYIVQALALSGVAVFVWRLWRAPNRPAVKAMALLSASLLAVPVMLFYEYPLVGVFMAWLIRDIRTVGYGGWEKSTFVLIVILSLVGRGIGHSCHIPLYPLGSLGLLVLTWRRSRLIQGQHH